MASRLVRRSSGPPALPCRGPGHGNRATESRRPRLLFADRSIYIAPRTELRVCRRRAPCARVHTFGIPGQLPRSSLASGRRTPGSHPSGPRRGKVPAFLNELSLAQPRVPAIMHGHVAKRTGTGLASILSRRHDEGGQIHDDARDGASRRFSRRWAPRTPDACAPGACSWVSGTGWLRQIDAASTWPPWHERATTAMDFVRRTGMRGGILDYEAHLI